MLSPEDYLQFVRRWNSLQFKLSEAATFLSLNDFATSFKFVRSLSFDVEEMHKLIDAAAKNVNVFLICQKVFNVFFFARTSCLTTHSLLS